MASLYFLASLKIESVDGKAAVEVAKDDFPTEAATVIDIIERIDQLYSDPINNIIPVAEVFSVAARASNGGLKESADEVFKD